ncbi:hypothetical protein Esi_0139_0006 [Ectocarpus siliculosus]|uniref:Uncharacterized protein n=1 Tax=Ectocarpus siliculosus TaxID=2880 RepID=D7FJY8_ECTSI|nr:hypothetical protein Esi_0139_0006 [Ectocarpus siliculosus]|eukprot:CBJ49077.1 hypothetical protein Esi_0139_0006 [Ectocarpus siliculosus]
MPARKKMFVQIIKFFQEQKPSTLPEWVQKVKKRPSFPIAVEAVLYQQASSLGDYEDYTAVAPRLSRIIRSMNKEVLDAMAKADRTVHSNGGKDKQQAHNCQATLPAVPERGVLPMKEAGKPPKAQQAVRAAQTPEEKATVAAKAMGEAAAAAPAYAAAAAQAVAAVGSSKDEEGARKPMSRAERRAAERERVKGAAKAAKSARLQQHLAQQNLRKSNDPRRVEGQLLAAADNPPAGAQPVPPPDTKPAAATAAAGSRTSIPSEPAAAPGKAQIAQSARAAKAPAVTAAAKREVSQAPAEERGNRAAARAPAAVLEETVTETSSSRSSPGGEWTWPLLALDGGGGALKGKRTATAPLRGLAWIGRAAGPTAGNRAEPLPWGNWKRWREPEKWEKTVSAAITRAQVKVGFDVDTGRLRNESVRSDILSERLRSRYRRYWFAWLDY